MYVHVVPVTHIATQCTSRRIEGDYSMDYRRPFRSFNEHRHSNRLKKRRAEANCEVPAKQVATEELVAEHLQQLYIDPTAVTAHAAALSPPYGGYPWWQGQKREGEEVAIGTCFAARSRRPEDDEMTAIMNHPHQAVPYIRLTPPTPVQSEHVKAPPPKWQVVLEDLDGEESGDDDVESEGEEAELMVELSPEVHQHLKSSTSQLLTASRLRSLPCLAVVPWTPPSYFIARAMALSDRKSASQHTQTCEHSNSHESMES